jgi:hypothetical protein
MSYQTPNGPITYNGHIYLMITWDRLLGLCRGTVADRPRVEDHARTEDQMTDETWGVWKIGQKRDEAPLFSGTREQAMTWAKEHHADGGPYHVRETVASLEARGIPYR